MLFPGRDLLSRLTGPPCTKRQSFCTISRKDERMKHCTILWLLVIVSTMALSSCEIVGGIFKAGFWTAIILIVLVVALILWLVGRSRR